MLHNYKTKIISLLVLVAFIYTGFSLNQYIENCSFKNIFCCCENSDKDISGFLDSNEKCCCEIKEVTNTQLETTLNSFEINPKLQNYIIKNYSDSNSELAISGIANEFRTIHFPPIHIYLLNSNLRI